MTEIERKFLVHLNSIPANADVMEIVQGYLVTGDPELRVREWNGRYWMAVKAGKGVVRTEVEVELDPADGKQLLDLCVHRVVKTRYHVGRWELDVFHGKHSGLVLMEQELPHPDAELDPLPPEVVVLREVTDEPEYANKNLAQK